MGLITDTGRFMYENTPPRAHEMAAELIEAGVDVPRVYRRLYEDMTIGKLALLGIALARIQRFDDGELALVDLTATDFAARRGRGKRLRGRHRPAARPARHQGGGARPRGHAAASAQASAKSRCGRPTTRSTCRRSRAPRAAAAMPRGRLLDDDRPEELVEFLRAEVGAQPNSLPGGHAPHPSPEGSGPGAAPRGRRPPDRQARRDHLPRRGRGRAPVPRAGSRPVTPGRSTRSRPAC